MNKSAGFTLLEVLIALIILAGGLLGLAGLQATSLKNNQSAYNRSVATQLAYEIADRMRANYNEAKSGNAYLATPPTTEVTSCKSPTGTPPGCSPANMALNDLYEWNQSVQNSLPGGTGTIQKEGVVFTITINWVENRYLYDDKDKKAGIVSGVTSFRMGFEL